MAKSWRLVRLVTTRGHYLLSSCLVIIYTHTAIRITIAVCMHIKVTHILARHVPISNIDHLVAHFTPDIDSFEKVAACATQLRCGKEF